MNDLSNKELIAVVALTICGGLVTMFIIYAVFELLGLALFNIL